MGSLKELAGTILELLYEWTVNEDIGRVSSEAIAEALEMPPGTEQELDRALRYLQKKKFIEGMMVSRGKWKYIGLTREGSNVKDDKDKFRRSFGVEVGIPGVVKLKWEAEER